jgi:REP element-mobilizing transposase RayT
MARPLRIEFEGALFHVTSRGDRRESIYDDDEDRALFLATFADVIDRMNWLCHAYCLMTNHYHLLIETPDGNLSKGMRQLNGVFTQASNRRHGRCGHLFQGRFKGILVDKEPHLLELSRYVVLNPVRAGMVTAPTDWPWSSYRAMVGTAEPPAWLETSRLLARFGACLDDAKARYAQFVAEGIHAESPWEQLRGQIYLGDEDFVRRMQSRLESKSLGVNIPKRQRKAPAPSLEQLSAEVADRDQAIVAAYRTGQYSYQEIGDFFGLHFTTVAKIVRKRRLTDHQ